MMGLAVNFADAHDMDGLFREIRKGRVGFRTSCVPVGAVVEWARERMTHSYGDVLKYIEGNYGLPKAWVSRGLVNNFVNSTGRAWDIVGRFAVGCSTLYSGAKLLTY